MTTPTRKPLAWLVAGALLALSAPGLPAAAAGDDIPITDPALLESLGLEPDAANVCPDAPLTRGQMAAFLGKALGLHWGTF